MIKVKFKLRRFLAWGIIFSLFAFLGLVDNAYAVDYSGLISVKNGVPLTPSPIPPDLPTNLRFFLNDSSPSPVAAGLDATSINAQGTAANAIYNIVPFGTITVLADDGTHYGRTSTGKNINSSVNETMTFIGGSYKTYELIAFDRPYEKKTPYAPASIGVIEAQTRINDLAGEPTNNVEMTLTITINANTGSSPNLRELANVNATGSYVLLLYKPGDAINNPGTDSNNVTGPVLIRTGSNVITLKGSYLVPNTPYKLVAWNRNWWSAASDTPASFTEGTFGSDSTINFRGRTWTTGAGGGGETSQSWLFRNITTGINTFAIPFNTAQAIKNNADLSIDLDSNGTITVEELIRSINSQIDPAKATTFGWWNEAAQQHVGFTSIALNGDGTINTTTSTAIGGTPTAVKAMAITTGEAYQVSIDTDNRTFVLKGTK